MCLSLVNSEIQIIFGEEQLIIASVLAYLGLELCSLTQFSYTYMHAIRGKLIKAIPMTKNA